MGRVTGRLRPTPPVPGKILFNPRLWLISATPEGEGCLAKVFLSYSREDAAAAKQLAESMARAGHQVWWDRQIQGGSRFATEIDRELKEADAVVVLWTRSSVESAWVQDEAAEGRDTGRLVPATLHEVRPPLGFRQF